MLPERLIIISILSHRSQKNNPVLLWEYEIKSRFYAEQDRLCDYLAIPNERRLKDVFVVFHDNGDAAYVKIFTWYSAYEIQINLEKLYTYGIIENVKAIREN